MTDIDGTEDRLGRRIWKRAFAPLHRLGTPPVRRAAAILVAVIAGGWLGLLLGGNLTSTVGPVEAQFSVRPALTGDMSVDVSPLGSVSFDTHDGPLRVEASVEQIRAEAAQRIVERPQSLTGLGHRVVEDLRSALVRLAVQASLSAVLGASLTALVLFRRWRWVGAAALGSAGFLLAASLTGYFTFNRQAIEEPRYTGLLVSAPSVVGNVETLAENFSRYRAELASLVTSLSEVYTVTSNLTSYEPDPSTTRVLHVSDLHLNPASWSIMHSVVEQFNIDVIIDTGDIVDTGSTAENEYVEDISDFDIPYVYVRGNHDTAETAQAVAENPNAVVLDGAMREVAGLRIFGAGDPRVGPDQGLRREAANQAARDAGLAYAQRLRDAAPPDLAAFHDPLVARGLDGTVPLALAGHTHERSTEVLQQGTRLMVQGSTGGAGLRALQEQQEPTPLNLSVLYIDNESGRMQAWDAITVGGLGLSSAQIARNVVDEPDREISPPSPSPAPTRTPTLPPTRTYPATPTTDSE